MTDNPPELLSCFGKLLRARTHIHELVEAMNAFRDQQHYTFDRYDNSDADTDPLVRVQWRVRVIEPIPDTWAYIVGDAIQNMRSALDHAVGQVARQRLDFGDADVQRCRLQFPICDSAADFRKARADLQKAGMPQDVLKALARLQPYNNGGDPGLGLAELRDLSNLDKHRQITVVAQGIYDSDVTVDPPLELVNKDVKRGPLTDGMVFATVKWKRTPRSGELVLRPSVRYVESLFVPWRDEYWPVGVVMEMAFTDVVLAVEELVRDHMGPLDAYFMEQYLDGADEREDKILGLVATDDQIREFRASLGEAARLGSTRPTGR